MYGLYFSKIHRHTSLDMIWPKKWISDMKNSLSFPLITSLCALNYANTNVGCFRWYASFLENTIMSWKKVPTKALYFENLIHHAVKSGKSIRQPKRHHQEFIQSEGSLECGLRHIRMPYLHMMIPTFEINITEYCRSLQSVHGIGKRFFMVILLSALINACLPRAIFLLYQ